MFFAWSIVTSYGLGIATLKYYVLVDQAYKHVELYEKESKDRWIVTYPKDQLVFQDLDIVLDIEEIYRQVDFENLDSNPWKQANQMGSQYARFAGYYLREQFHD